MKDEKTQALIDKINNMTDEEFKIFLRTTEIGKQMKRQCVMNLTKKQEKKNSNLH